MLTYSEILIIGNFDVESIGKIAVSAVTILN